jgi:hypothetical protein
VLSEDRRFIVGRSGSSAGAFVDDVLDPDVEVVLSVVPAEPAELSELSDRRFIVGRSGSSAGVLPVDCPAPCVDAVLVLVLPDDPAPPEPALSSDVPDVPEDRRFIVGRSGSFAESLAAPVPAPAFVVDFDAPVELVNTGSVFEGFNFATFFGAASGFTLPYPNQPSSYAISPVAFSACRCRAYTSSSMPLSAPASCSSYTFPDSSANGTGRATYTPASSSLPSTKIDTGISLLAVGLAMSPVHSYTPTARTTCSGFATLCICPHAAAPPADQPASIAPANIARRKISLINPVPD